MSAARATARRRSRCRGAALPARRTFFPRLLTAAAALATLLAAGCETTPEVVPVADPERAYAERQARIAALGEWTALGRLALRVPDDSWTVNVRWQQSGDGYRIRLSGPLGQGIMELDGAPGRVEMRTAENEIYRAASAERLVWERSGWRLPVGGLRYWILGTPDPDAPVEALELDAGGRPAHLRQSGWDIRFESYDDSHDIALPARISLEGGDVGARMVLREWTLGPES